MKIIFFAGFPKAYGGFEKVFSILISYLEKKGIDISIYTLVDEKTTIPSKKNWLDFLQNRDVKVLRYTYPKYLGEKFARWIGKTEIYIDDRYSQDIKNTISRANIAIIWEPSFIIPIHRFLVQNGFKGKIVGWFHNSIFGSGSKVKTIIKKIFFRYFIKKHIEKCELILSISKGIEKQVKSVASHIKVTTVYNPVLPDNYEETHHLIRSPTKGIIFAYVGRISNFSKNLKFMFKGLSKLDFDWKLKILGTGPDEDMLRKYSRKLGIEDKIVWLGFSRKPFEVLREEGVTALLLTSRFEGLGIVLIESISYGIPVIASDCDVGPSEIVIPGVNGYLFRAGHLRDFINKVKGFIRGELKIADRNVIKKTVGKFRYSLVCENIYKELENLNFN